jgi:hypothetical protein
MAVSACLSVFVCVCVSVCVCVCLCVFVRVMNILSERERERRGGEGESREREREREREMIRNKSSTIRRRLATLRCRKAPPYPGAPGRPLKVCLCLCLCLCLWLCLHVRVLRRSRGIGEQGAQKRLARDLLSASRKQPGSRHSAHRDHPQLMRLRNRMQNSEFLLNIKDSHLRR